MLKTIKAAQSISGDLVVPGDKSITHRALLLNAIASGKARVSQAGSGDDINSTLSCLRVLGAQVDETSDGFYIQGVGLHGLKEPKDILNAGQSGTTMRLITGILAGQDFLSIITGSGSLLNRPMDRVIVPLKLMGAKIMGRARDSLAPLAIRGVSLKGLDYATPVASAQVKSAILLGGLYARGETIVREPGESRNHTELMLLAMGARVVTDGNVVTLHPPGNLKAIDISVPGDFSSAAFWIAAAVIHPNARIKVRNVGVNPTRTGLLDALSLMGAKVRLENRRQVGAEPVADIVAESSQLKGVEIGKELIPRLEDEVPALALIAAFASGKTVIRDAGELRVKESDRISTTVEELSKIGARISELGTDAIVIEGNAGLRGAECSSHDDHRLAMAMAVAGLAVPGSTFINGAEAVTKSYPSFWQELDRLVNLN